ncbi:MAG: type II toxin-antitoxin system RelE/ParE family toxin [Pseudomonadota bacterium]|nr:type II toxin-antitoxin system RelE/ParE family toxin [Pseudomonadota bacterium]
MKRARFIALAREEFLTEVAYYDQVQPGQGSRFVAAAEEATVRALAFPLAGAPSAPGARRVFLKGFPFSIVYRPEADGIVVFAVAHHSRLPGYWRSRVGTPT